MRKALRILPLLIAMLFVTVPSAIPHHHHKQMVCTVMDICDADNFYNHTSSHDASEMGSTQGDECSVKAEYIAGSTTLSGRSLSDDDDSQFVVKYLCVLASYIIDNLNNTTFQHRYNRDIVPYDYALLGLNSGLRAPPYCLS